MTTKNMDVTRNDRLRDALGSLPEAEAWLRHDLPLRALEQECSSLCRDSEFRLYLTRHPSIRAAMETGFYVLAWSRNHPVPQTHPHEQDEQALALAIGKFLTEWIPTFLLIDGPIGRLLTRSQSPLIKMLEKGFPVLSVARRLIIADRYEHMRNGIAHWSFQWNQQVNPPTIQIFGWRDGQNPDEVIAAVPWREAMYYHDVMETLIVTLYPHVSGMCRCVI